MMSNATDFEARELTPQQHKARMERILSVPVPSGQDFEKKLSSLLKVKEKTFAQMKESPDKAASARDIEAIRWALTGHQAR